MKKITNKEIAKIVHAKCGDAGYGFFSHRKIITEIFTDLKRKSGNMKEAYISPTRIDSICHHCDDLAVADGTFKEA